MKGRSRWKEELKREVLKLKKKEEQRKAVKFYDKLRRVGRGEEEGRNTVKNKRDEKGNR